MKIKRFRLWKPVEVALLVGLVLSILSGVWAVKTQNRLADQVVRLHVLANSDSPEDQALKLEVRDAVLQKSTELLKGSTSRQEAEVILRRNLPALRKVSEEQIAAQGYAYPVDVVLEVTGFPTKAYDGFSLPAGKYLALRVLIGAAAGQNWWCVAFPPLCTTATADVAVTALAAGMEPEDVRLIMEEDGYVLKFKAVEWWQNLRRMDGLPTFF